MAGVESQVLPVNLKSPAQQEIQQAEYKKQGKKQQVDALLLAYMYIFESVQLDHNTAQIQAKKVENNAIAQGRIIHEEAGVNFNQLSKTQLEKEKVTFYLDGMKFKFTATGSKGDKMYAALKKYEAEGKIKASQIHVHWEDKKVKATQLENLESQNQEVSAVRNVMEDKLTVLRQSAQIGETDLNTVMDADQQSVQQGASMMQMLVSLTNQVTKI